MVATPSQDAFSFIAMFIPLEILYELALLVARVMERRHPRAVRQGDSAVDERSGHGRVGGGAPPVPGGAPPPRPGSRYNRGRPMSNDTQTRPLSRARRRRAARRPRLHWWRLALIVLAVAVVSLVAGLTGTIVAVSRTLPKLDDMTKTHLGQNTVIYDRNGRRIAELYGAMNRVVVRSDQIPQVMKDATVAIEDQRFYEHHGVDFSGIATRAGRATSRPATSSRVRAPSPSSTSRTPT